MIIQPEKIGLQELTLDSIASKSDFDVESLQSSSVSTKSDSVFDKRDQTSGSTRSREISRDLTSKLFTNTQKEKIASISTSSVIGPLDYEIFPLQTSSLCRLNHVKVSEGIEKSPQTLEIRDVIQQPHNGLVIAMTGTTGSVRGSISENPIYLKMAGCESFQELWQVELERPTSKYSIC